MNKLSYVQKRFSQWIGNIEIGITEILELLAFGVTPHLDGDK